MARPTLVGALASISLSLGLAYAQFSEGVMRGFGDSLKGTWNLVSHDMWQLSTYREMGTTLTALSLLDPFDVERSLASMRWSVRQFGVYVEGTVAPQANPVGGGAHQLLRVVGRETNYVHVPYK